MEQPDSLTSLRLTLTGGDSRRAIQDELWSLVKHAQQLRHLHLTGAIVQGFVEQASFALGRLTLLESLSISSGNSSFFNASDFSAPFSHLYQLKNLFLNRSMVLRQSDHLSLFPITTLSELRLRVEKLSVLANVLHNTIIAFPALSVLELDASSATSDRNDESSSPSFLDSLIFGSLIWTSYVFLLSPLSNHYSHPLWNVIISLHPGIFHKLRAILRLVNANHHLLTDVVTTHDRYTLVYCRTPNMRGSDSFRFNFQVSP